MKRLWPGFLASMLLATPSFAQYATTSPPPMIVNTPPSTAVPSESPYAPIAGDPGNTTGPFHGTNTPSSSETPTIVDNGSTCSDGNCGVYRHRPMRSGGGCSTCGDSGCAPRFAPRAGHLFRTCGDGSCGGGASCGGASCGGGGCGGCDICGPCGRFWGEFDYILWKTQGDWLPPLITTSAAGTQQSQAGLLGTNRTTILVGNDYVNDEFRSGFRYNVGTWLNRSQTLGVQIGGFWVQDATQSFNLASDGGTILVRPFVDATTGQPASQLIAFTDPTGANVVFGSGNVSHDSSSVIGLDAALRGNMCCGSTFRLDAIFGYRYLRLADNLHIRENLTAGPAAPGAIGVPAGTNIVVVDSFAADNTFHGLQTGVTGEWRLWPRLILSGTAKISLGYINQNADIQGATTITTPGGAPIRMDGGLLALNSNIGTYEHSEGQLIPELNANVGYQLNDNIRLRAGYSFLFIQNVWRAGDRIDLNVNPRRIPPVTPPLGVARPEFQDGNTSYLLHGFNAGLEIRF